MTRICYVEKKFGSAALSTISMADQIMRKYASDGYSLTLRQLYYQFVARGLIANKDTEYKRLGSVVNDARMAGLLDWDNIEDRTRGIEKLATWTSPSRIIRDSADQYKIDMWQGQDIRPEVWVEKEALAGVVEPVAEELRVDWLACRGYLSQSEAWRAGQRIIDRFNSYGQRTLILHLGDHDPSGIDMTRDNRDRLEIFCYHHLGEVPFELKRIALNMDQVEEHNPPPNPAKITDSRATGYIERFGDESWELDALDPATISQLVTDEVEEVKDPDKWDTRLAREESERGLLEKVSAQWAEVVARLETE